MEDEAKGTLININNLLVGDNTNQGCGGFTICW